MPATWLRPGIDRNPKEVPMTKIITLTRGFEAMVDDEDYEWLNQWKWSATQNGYAYRRGPMNIYMHNAIMKNTSGTEVDHVHGIAFDNRKSELRICTHAENCANGKIRNTNTSGYKGVSWHKQTGKWRAYIVKSNKQTSLGLFDNVIDAAHAYDKVAYELFGEFAHTNFQEGLTQ